MTTEEAIQILDPATSRDALMKKMGGIWNQPFARALLERAQKMGLEALRAQIEKPISGKPIYNNRPEWYDSYRKTGETQDGELLYRKERKLLENNPVAYCGVCRKRLCSRFMNFCPACGAKVDVEEGT